MTKDQTNTASNVGVYLEEQFNVTDTLTLVLGGRGQYAYRSVSDHFLQNNDQSGHVDYFAVSPKVGGIWHVTPSVQVYGNISNAYEPPLILELTAPGQIGGSLDQLQAQKSWQFEVGTRGQLGTRLVWDVALYDIELRDEIQNVNVAPFPGAPFTIPRYQNIDRSRHLGVEVGGTVTLLPDVSGQLGLGSVGDTLALRLAYTWSHFVFVDDPQFGNNQLPGAPAHYLRSELRYTHPVGLWVAPGIESVPAGYAVTSDNTAQTDPYTLFHFRLGYDYKPWQSQCLL